MNRTIAALLALGLLAACNRGQEDNSAAVEKGIERSVADVRAARAAAAGPVELSLSAGARSDAARNRADALHERARAKADRNRERGEGQENEG